MDAPLQNPTKGISYVPYETPLVQFIDNLIEYAKKNGSTSQIVTESDWKTLDYIMQGFETLYPELSHTFYENMKEWRKQSTLHAVAKGEFGARIQHQLEIPQKVYLMIQIIFPNQKWDKKFVKKFASHYKQFKGAEQL